MSTTNILLTLIIVLLTILVSIAAYVTTIIRKTSINHDRLTRLSQTHHCPNKVCSLTITGTCLSCNSYLATRYNALTVVTTKTPPLNATIEISMAHTLVPYSVSDILLNRMPTADHNNNASLAHAFTPIAPNATQTPMPLRTPQPYQSSFHASMLPQPFAPTPEPLDTRRMPKPSTSTLMNPRLRSSIRYPRRSTTPDQSDYVHNVYHSNSSSTASPVHAPVSLTSRQQEKSAQPTTIMPSTAMSPDSSDDENTPVFPDVTPTVPFSHPTMTQTYEPPFATDILLSPTQSETQLSFPVAPASTMPAPNYNRANYFDTTSIIDNLEEHEVDLPSFTRTSTPFPTSAITLSLGLLSTYLSTRESPILDVRQSTLTASDDPSSLELKLDGHRTRFLPTLTSAHQLLHAKNKPPVNDPTCFICYANSHSDTPEQTEAIPMLLKFARASRTLILDDENPIYKSQRKQLNDSSLMTFLRHV